MKKLITLSAILFATNFLFAQEVSYFISAEADGEATYLDSVLFENITNQSRILFEELPLQDNYVINLISQGDDDFVGLQQSVKDDYFKIIKNIPGEFEFSISNSSPHNLSLEVYNLSGQIIFKESLTLAGLNKSISVNIPNEGMYILSVRSDFKNESFRIIGGNSTGEISTSMDNSISYQSSNTIESTVRKHTSNFSFEIGDSIRVSAYLKGYYVYPKALRIVNSEALAFEFKSSQVNETGVSDAYINIDKDEIAVIERDAETGNCEILILSEETELKPGDIITVDLDTTGLIQQVISTTTQNGQIVLKTKSAYMDDLFINKRFKLNTKLIEPNTQLKGTPSDEELMKALTDEEGFIHPVKIIYHDVYGNKILKSALNTKSDEFRANIIDMHEDLSGTNLVGNEGDNLRFFINEGYASLVADAVFEFEFEHDGELNQDTKVKKGDLEYFSFYLDGNADFMTKLGLNLSTGFELEDSKKLATVVDKATAYFVVPPSIPVWITFDVDIYGKYHVSADASLSAGWGFESHDEVKVGGIYNKASRDFSPINDFTHSQEIYPLTIEGELNAFARMELYPRAEMKFYGFFGPYAEIVPYVSGNYNAIVQSQITSGGIENFLAWNSGIDLGLDFRAGTKFSFLGFFERESGPLVINCFNKTVWSAPYKVELLSDLPDEAAVNQTIRLDYQITDYFGNSVPLCPVYVSGDGEIEDEIMVTGIDGEFTVYWTISSEGQNAIDLQIFDANNSQLDVITTAVTGTPGIEAPPNAIIVNTTPSGASIYFDGTNLNLTTPDTIFDVEPNTTHQLRLFLDGYNEYNETFTLGEEASYVIDVILEEPQPPLPTFTITSPQNNDVFESNVITVSGLIELVDMQGNVTDFVGNTAILTLNGNDRQILVNNGQFQESISIINGENRISLRANSADGETGFSDEIVVTGDFEATYSEVTLTWNTPTSDMDLHIWAPNGEHCYYANQIISNGNLDIDDVEGYGPETFTFIANPTPGPYVFKVNSYSLDRDPYTDVSIQITDSEGNVQNIGPKRFTVADYNGDNSDAWWDVIVIEIGSETKSATVIPEWLRNKIEYDMANLPEK